MGSDSDLPVVAKGLQVLEDLQISFEVNILSAHRTPNAVASWAKSAEQRGVKVIVAAAGLAAHLPGILAAYTVLPVIGLPIAAGPLQGSDALYAIVQMPPGIPVATVGLSNATNAAILAAQILALSDSDLNARLAGYRRQQAEAVHQKQERLQTTGWRNY